MARRYPMSDAQRQVLRRMAQGEAIVIKDGPYVGENRVRFNTLWALTAAGWVNSVDDPGRWVITDIGRAALAEQKEAAHSVRPLRERATI